MSAEYEYKPRPNYLAKPDDGLESLPSSKLNCWTPDISFMEMSPPTVCRTIIGDDVPPPFINCILS